MYTPDNWSSCEKCTISDEYNEKCRLCIRINCIENIKYKLKTLIPVLKTFVTLILKDSHTAIVNKCDQWENTYPGMTEKNRKQDFRLFLRGWYCRGLNCFGRESSLRLNRWNNKRIWFLRHQCEDNGNYDSKPTDFYLAVTESDSPFKTLYVMLLKLFQIHEFYHRNDKSVIDFT